MLSPLHGNMFPFISPRPPAVVAPVFERPDIAGLKVDLDVDSLSGLADQTGIATWTDESGVGNHWTQTNSGARMAYRTNILNGHGAVRVLPWPSWLDGGDLSAQFPTAIHMFMLYTVRDDFYVGYDHLPLNDSWWSYSQTGYFGTFHASRLSAYPATMPISGTHLIAIKSSTSTYEVRLDKVSKGVQTPDYLTTTKHFIGAGPQNKSSNMDYFKIMLYNSILSSANEQAVENYITDKFGL